MDPSFVKQRLEVRGERLEERDLDLLTSHLSPSRL
jgi:hypothetical protein